MNSISCLTGHTTRAPPACKRIWQLGRIRAGDQHPVLCFCHANLDRHPYNCTKRRNSNICFAFTLIHLPKKHNLKLSARAAGHPPALPFFALKLPFEPEGALNSTDAVTPNTTAPRHYCGLRVCNLRLNRCIFQVSVGHGQCRRTRPRTIYRWLGICDRNCPCLDRTFLEEQNPGNSRRNSCHIALVGALFLKRACRCPQRLPPARKLRVCDCPCRPRLKRTGFRLPKAENRRTDSA